MYATPTRPTIRITYDHPLLVNHPCPWAKVEVSTWPDGRVTSRVLID